MDYVRPTEALIPGAQGRILGVLARTTAEINLRTVAELAGVSPAQTTRVLSRLVHLGVVRRREAPPSALFHLAQANLGARLVLEITRLPEAARDELAGLAQDLDAWAVNVTLFGSFARGDARTDSDVDVLVVRATEVGEDDPAWATRLATFADEAAERVGNPVNVLEVSESEIGPLLRSRRVLWREALADGVTLAGRPLEALRHHARA